MAPEEGTTGSIDIELRDGIVRALKALGDPVRLEMVRRLQEAGGTAACVQLYDDVTKSTASHHFRVLREAGLITSVANGPGRVVSLNDEALPPGPRAVITAVLGQLDVPHLQGLADPVAEGRIIGAAQRGALRRSARMNG